MYDQLPSSCSAGVGRTGTLIVLDTQLKQVEDTGKFDVFNNVMKIRKQRNLLVQTEVCQNVLPSVLKHIGSALSYFCNN